MKKKLTTLVLCIIAVTTTKMLYHLFRGTLDNVNWIEFLVYILTIVAVFAVMSILDLIDRRRNL